MRATTIPGIIKSVGIIAAFSLMAGCTVTPSVRGAESVALRLSLNSDLDLDLVNAADPSTRPGPMAGGMAKQGMDDCSDASAPVFSLVFAPFCAAAGAAVGAAAGAVMTQTTTLPEPHAAQLNVATFNAMNGTNWLALFDGTLRAEAVAVGMEIVPANDGYGRPMYVEVNDLEWDIAAGDTVAMHALIAIAVRGQGHTFNRKQIEVRSKRMRVPQWTKDDGAPIRDGLRSLIEEASRAVWQTVAG